MHKIKHPNEICQSAGNGLVYPSVYSHLQKNKKKPFDFSFYDLTLSHLTFCLRQSTVTS